ncbi:MAG: hypothetical protein EU533_02955 [Promethearchaeota archaeon]|nr:MAG: hypothetical protein EU533_02955 [Candidatus Lokiarchaeota archaeon]
MIFDKNTRKKNYSWIFPLIGGILTLIGMVSPTATFSYSGVNWSWWMWNLTVMSVIGYGSVSTYPSEIDFILPSMITTVAISLSLVMLLIFSYKTKKREISKKGFILGTFPSAAITIGVLIYYANAMQIAFIDGVTIEGEVFPAGYIFWDVFSPSFGIILPVLGAILAIIGVGVHLSFLKQREIIGEQYIYTPIPTEIPRKIPIEIGTPKITFNFCPECGNKLLNPDFSYCTNCGFKLHNS